MQSIQENQGSSPAAANLFCAGRYSRKLSTVVRVLEHEKQHIPSYFIPKRLLFSLNFNTEYNKTAQLKNIFLFFCCFAIDIALLLFII